MGFLYKLIDEKELEFAKDGKISFSHPIFEFKGSEGKFINFAKRIHDKYLEQGLKIKPSSTDIDEIADWIKIYKATYGREFQDKDIISESMIIFCGIMQGYCGYFTTVDLFDKEQLTSYLSKNKLREKKYVLKLDESVFENNHWRTNDLDEGFIPWGGDSNDLREFNGFTHPIDIVYNANYDDYNELLKIYNSDELRHAHKWFNNLSQKFEWQKEKRIIFLLRSLEKNSSRIGCDSVYQCHEKVEDYVKQVYCNIVDAIDYCHKGPKYIYLKVGLDKLEWESIDKLKS